jgi:hypothetical protein
VNSGLTNHYISSLAVASNGTGGTNLFAGTWSGIFRSTNYGTSWSAVDSGLTDKRITTLFADGTSIFAGTVGGCVFIFTEEGRIWTEYNSRLGYVSITSLVTAGPNLFAGTGVGLFLYTEGGKIRTEVDSRVTGWVKSLTINGTDIFVGTWNGVWRRPLSEIIITGVESRGSRTTKSFSLYQNYPNPFNPKTTFTFTLPSRSFVTLKVYDLIGREIATLVNNYLFAGSYSQQWDAANVSSGIYFYRLQAGSYSETKKLILLK